MRKNLMQIKDFGNKIYKNFYGAIEYIAKKLVKMDVNANFISILGFIVGLIAINFIAMENYFYGLLLVLVNRFFDIVDGSVAKRQSIKSEFGVFLDATLDYIFYAGVVFAFALANPVENSLAAAFLLACFCAATVAVLSYGIIAYKKDVQKKLPAYLGGTFQSWEMVVATILMCVMPSLFMPLAILFGIVSLVKAFSVIITSYYVFVINK